MSGKVELKTACNRDCPDACGIVATVEDGKIQKIRGDKDHPVTKGFLCSRTSRFLERQYATERLLHPLMRRNGTLEVCTWDDALDHIAENLAAVKQRFGASAIFHYRSGGSMGMMKHLSDYFFECFGPVAVKTGDICTGAGDAAQMTDFGEEDCSDLFQILKSRTIILWGKNVFVSSVHLLPVLREAKSNGATIVLIDPVCHRTVEIADTYIQPRPGGDIALGLAIAQILFSRNLTDPPADQYCDHLDEFKSLAFRHSLEHLSELSGVSLDALFQLAAIYSKKPAAILVGWGLQRRAFGSASVRVIDALAAVSGNLGIEGGGVSFCYKRRGAFDLSFIKGEAVAPRTILEPVFGPAILEAADPPVEIVWVTAANPVAMLPDSLAVQKAQRTRRLTVVVDSFLTDTAQCADIVLPTTTMLEDDDLLGSYGHHWIAEMKPVTQPPPNVLTDYQIMQALARRFGMKGDFELTVEQWKRRLTAGAAEKGVSLEDLRTAPAKSPFAPRVMFENRKFETPSGRVNLIVDACPEPARGNALRPMLLSAISSEKAQGSQWSHESQHGPPVLTVHPASANGFKNGDMARLESETNQMVVVLRLDERQRRDMALMEKGGWLSRKRCANSLVPAKSTDAGGGAVYYDTPVRLLPCPAVLQK